MCSLLLQGDRPVEVSTGLGAGQVSSQLPSCYGRVFYCVFLQCLSSQAFLVVLWLKLWPKLGQFLQLGFLLFPRGAFSFPVLTQIIAFDVFLHLCLSEDSKSCVSSTRLTLCQVDLFRYHVSCFSPCPAFTSVEERGALCPKESFILSSLFMV